MAAHEPPSLSSVALSFSSCRPLSRHLFFSRRHPGGRRPIGSTTLSPQPLCRGLLFCNMDKRLLRHPEQREGSSDIYSRSLVTPDMFRGRLTRFFSLTQPPCIPNHQRPSAYCLLTTKIFLHTICGQIAQKSVLIQ